MGDFFVPPSGHPAPHSDGDEVGKAEWAKDLEHKILQDFEQNELKDKEEREREGERGTVDL